VPLFMSCREGVSVLKKGLPGEPSAPNQGLLPG